MYYQVVCTQGNESLVEISRGKKCVKLVYDSFLVLKMNEDKIAGERQETC